MKSEGYVVSAEGFQGHNDMPLNIKSEPQGAFFIKMEHVDSSVSNGSVFIIHLLGFVAIYRRSPEVEPALLLHLAAGTEQIHS